jgi:hypothetical protein
MAFATIRKASAKTSRMRLVGTDPMRRPAAAKESADPVQKTAVPKAASSPRWAGGIRGSLAGALPTVLAEGSDVPSRHFFRPQGLLPASPLPPAAISGEPGGNPVKPLKMKRLSFAMELRRRALRSARASGTEVAVVNEHTPTLGIWRRESP